MTEADPTITNLEYLVAVVEGTRRTRPECEVTLHIESVDNPGWMVTFDGGDLGIKAISVRHRNEKLASGAWLIVTAEGGIIRAVSGPWGIAPALEAMREALEAILGKEGHV